MADRTSPRRVNKTLRLFVLLAFLLLSLLMLLLMLQLTESALSIWQILDQMSPGLLAFYVSGLLAIALAILIVSGLLLKSGGGRKSSDAARQPAPVDRESLDRALEDAEREGVDTKAAREELEELHRRSEAPARYVVFFGAVSSGKSALIRAITGDEHIEVDPRAGTTRQVAHYPYQEGDQGGLILTDAPGILDLDPERVRVAREEARRADLIVYVCEGELTRDQFDELAELKRYQRPLLLAVNKPDRYSEDDLEEVLNRLGEQVPDIERVVVLSAGREAVIRVDAEGRESREFRPRPPRVEALLEAVSRRFETEGDRLGRLRDESLMRLGAEKLAKATAQHRRDASAQIVKGYARKAMIGAMAAVSPGTDILIQGYLGVRMVQDLSAIYGVKVQQADLDRFIALASQQVGKRFTLMLALAGNVLKAFPGIGTVGGGLMHAVAYGMIFEGLGQAVARALHESGDLQARQALDYFEEFIGEDMEGRAKRFARLAWQEFVDRR